MLKASCAKFQLHKYSKKDTASFAKKPSTIHIPTFGENNFPVILSLTCCYWLLSHKGHKEQESKCALFWVWRILKKSIRKKKLTVDNFEVLQWRSRPELFGPDVGIDAWKDGHLTPFWFTKTNVPTQPSTELKKASCSFPPSTETFMRDKVSEYWWTMVQIPSSSWGWTNRLSVCPVFEPKTELPIWRNLFHFERESGSQKITFGNTGINEAKHILEVMSPPTDEHFDDWLLGFLDIAQTHNRMLRCIWLPRLVAAIIFWYDK